MCHSSRKYTINGRFPSLNEFIAATRTTKGKWHKGNTMKQECQENIAWQLQNQDDRQIDNPVYIKYEFYEPNKKRDLDNIASFFIKVFQDALVKTGILKNDTWNYIEGYSIDFFVDKDNPRIEVEIEEYING